MYQAYCFYNKDKTPDWLMNHRMTVMIINFAFFRESSSEYCLCACRESPFIDDIL